MGKPIFWIIIIIIVVIAVIGVVKQFSGVINLSNTGENLLSYTLFKPSIYNNSSSGAVIQYQTPKQVVPIEQKTQTKPTIQPPTGFTVSQLSPFYKKLQVSGIVAPTLYGNTVSQFTLRADSIGTSTVNVTGWFVRSNQKGEYYIPQAIRVYNPFGPWTQQDIVLGQGDYVYVYSNKSPISKNLRLNKCTGYLNNQYDFSPDITNSCPSINRSEIITFSGECQTFLNSISGCREITATEKNRFSGYNNISCRNFLDTINFGGCYNKYSGDKDFLSHEWRVWAGAQMPFDRQHDRILLFDGDGLLVNEYLY